MLITSTPVFASVILQLVLLQLLLLQQQLVVVNAVLNFNFTPCATPAFKDGSFVDLDKMLYDCMDHIPSTLFPPSYFPDMENSYRSTNVSIQIALNNIIHVDDLTSQFTMDFFFRIIWTDPRLVMPEVWQYLHPKSIQEGIEISKYFDLQNQLQFWLPDIYFAQATEMETLNNLIKLKQDGLMFWARQMIVTFSNPQMPFYKFPNDDQVFTITLESFSYDSDFIRLFFPLGDDNGTAAVRLLTDYQQNDRPLVNNNQIWKYGGFSSFVMVTKAPSPTNPLRTYSTAFINMRFSRQSNGVIFRLALPVLIFLVIVGASFWSNEDERIEVTLQIILVVAALYVIIGQSIPFVGYLTSMDLFIIAVFAILAVTISVHFLTTLLSRKASKYPLDSFYRDTMVILFRGFWMPLSLSIFIGFFGRVHDAFLAIFGVFACGCIIFFAGKIKLVVRSYYLSLIRLKIKSDLVVLGALDEKTELPMKLTFTERWTLYLTQVMQQDGRIHMSDLFKKYKPGMDCSNGVTGNSSNPPNAAHLTSAGAGHAKRHHGRPKETRVGSVSASQDQLDAPNNHTMPHPNLHHRKKATNSDANSVASKRSNGSIGSIRSAAAQTLVRQDAVEKSDAPLPRPNPKKEGRLAIAPVDSGSEKMSIAMLNQKSFNNFSPSFYSKPEGSAGVVGNAHYDALMSDGGHFERPVTPTNGAKASATNDNRIQFPKTYAPPSSSFDRADVEAHGGIVANDSRDEYVSRQSDSTQHDQRASNPDANMNHSIAMEDEDVSVDDSDMDPLEGEDDFCEDEEVEALVNFKRNIAKEMGAVFTKRENALQFMANNSIRAKKPLEFTNSFRVKK